MPNFAETGKKLKTLFLNKKFLVIIFIVAVFLGVALFVYNNYIAPRINPDFVPNREFTTDGDNADIATLYFFGVDWCPYSKKAKPHWEKVKSKFNGRTENNVTINFVEIDGEKQEKELENFENEYLTPNKKKIDGYPSIWMVKGNDVIEYDAKPNTKSLTEYIKAAVF